MKEKTEKVEILQNATIIYTDKVKESYEAIQITDKGIIIGRILNNEFMRFGFIPQCNIKDIKNGSKRAIAEKRV